MEKCGKRFGRNRDLALEPRARQGVREGNDRETAALRACSACAGDYEDPDRTAWMFDEADSEECGETLDTGAEEFPAKER